VEIGSERAPVMAGGETVAAWPPRLRLRYNARLS
jgi:hypothetical protein